MSVSRPDLRHGMLAAAVATGLVLGGCNVFESSEQKAARLGREWHKLLEPQGAIVGQNLEAVGLTGWQELNPLPSSNGNSDGSTYFQINNGELRFSPKLEPVKDTKSAVRGIILGIPGGQIDPNIELTTGNPSVSIDLDRAKFISYNPQTYPDKRFTITQFDSAFGYLATANSIRSLKVRAGDVDISRIRGIIPR